jgi:hypothetical protein
LSPLATEMLSELGQRRKPLPLVPIRRRGCACRLADGYRLEAGDALFGRRRSLVRTSATGATANVQAVVLPLAEQEADFLTRELSCRHASQVTVPLADVQQAISDAAVGRRARSVVFWL